MMFSIIIGTINRDKTIKYCLDSLLAQSKMNFEIVIIDQSKNEKTREVVENYNDERIKYKKVDYKGLSKARNDAIKQSVGDYICLADDDAFYMPDYLDNAGKWIETLGGECILSGYIFDTIKMSQFANYDKKKHGKELHKQDIIKTCPSAALVIPKLILDTCGFFDEQFGVGSIYGAGEETDFLLRAKKRGYSVVYCKDLSLKHPFPLSEKTALTNNKMGSYYFGIGALYKKHIVGLHEYDLIVVYLKIIIKFLIKIMLPFKYDPYNVRYEFKNLLSGFRQYNVDTLRDDVE